MAALSTKSTRKGTKTAKGRLSTSNVNVPFVQAVTIRQTAVDRQAQSFRGSDILMTLGYTSTSPLGVPQLIKMSPLNYPNTRMGKMAANFQKYRYKSAVLRIITNQPTTVGGQIIAGYCSNPDQEFDSGSVNQVFALPGAEIMPLYVPQSMRATFEDKSKWYNLDLDSDEKMSTEAGMFVIELMSTVNVTGVVQAVIILDYELELVGAAVQSDVISGPALPFPSTLMSSSNPPTLGLAPGETLPFPTMDPTHPYTLNPEFDVPVTLNAGSVSEWAPAMVIQKVNGAPSNYQFFRSIDDYNKNTPIAVQFPTSAADRTFPRSTVSILN